MKQMKISREYTANDRRDTIEIPWMEGFEVGVLRDAIGGINGTRIEPDDIVVQVMSRSLRKYITTPQMYEETILIKQAVPYYISSDLWMSLDNVRMRLWIGDRITAEFGVGGSSFTMCGSTITFGEPLPVPPRQPCEAEIIFERNSHEKFCERIKKAIDNSDKGEFVRVGLKLIGTTRLTIRNPAL